MSKFHISDTKLKILTIIWYISAHGEYAYGYKIWKMLFKFNNTPDLRNVYHHLDELERMALIKYKKVIRTKNTPPQKVYELTDEGINVVARHGDVYMNWLLRGERYDKKGDNHDSIDRINGHDESGAPSPSLQRLSSEQNIG